MNGPTQQPEKSDRALIQPNGRTNRNGVNPARFAGLWLLVLLAFGSFWPEAGYSQAFYRGLPDQLPQLASAATPQSPDSVGGYEVTSTGKGSFYVPTQVPSSLPVSVTASYGWKGNDQNGEEVYVLQGDCRVVQGTDVVSGPKAVVWIRNRGAKEAYAQRQVTVYLEKENQWKPLQIELNSVFVDARANDLAWLGTFQTSGQINLHLAEPGSTQLDPDAVFYRAGQMRSTSNMPQMIPQTSQLSEDTDRLKNMKSGQVKFRRFRILSRHDYDHNISFQKIGNDDRYQAIINSGVTIMIEGITSDDKKISDVIDVSADRAVIWASGLKDQLSGKETIQAENLDLELFLDGDIIFREGQRVIYAKKMYYDAKNRVGLIQDTEVIMPIPSNPSGFFRIKADEITQKGPNLMTAKNTWVTTSMMGYPGYRLQSNQITAESRETPLFDATTRQPVLDPVTGVQKTSEEQFLIAEGNYVALESVPVFYWPWMAMDTREQTMYLRNIKVGNDSIFGFQAQTTWNPYQLLNMSKSRPDGTDWDLNIDWLSRRGLGHGSSFLYNRESLFGCPTPAIGMINFYGISDKGKDNLGLKRREVEFPHAYRYRGMWKHRQKLGDLGCLGNDWIFTGQFGTSSDRNYLAQYFEQEWYTSPNPETSLELKQTTDNRSFGIEMKYGLDKFYTQTNSLPQLDHYWMGQPLWCNKLIWYEHTKLAYDQFKTTNSPYATEDKELFRYLDWELASSSESNSPYSDKTQTLRSDSFNFSTRHELDVPLEAGPFKVTPYGLGDFSFWGRGSEEKNISRLYGRGGVRLNLPVWNVNTDVDSRTFYLNGLAHKMNFAIDASYSDANKTLDQLVLYDQLDDWQIEDFRRRYSVTTFGGSGYDGFEDSIPLRFDERYYALRHGQLGGAVGSPSSEIADDLTLVRFEWLNRWQTKRGPVGKRHTIDWITFNTGVNFYPKKEQNFDEYVGLVDYDLRWHVGDRFSVLSSGLYDFFDQGQKITRFGVMSKRPSVSSLYVGVDRLYGPIDSTYLNAAINYRMSQKWATSFSTSYDISESENVGQTVKLSRIGESFIFTLSGNINASKNNWGVSVSMIPVFLLDKKKVEEGVLDYAAF